MAARAVVLLARSRPNSYRYTIIALILGIGIGVTHMLVSRGLRGSSMPVDGVVYTSVLTLIVFLIFRLPKIREAVDFTSGEHNDRTGSQAGAITLLITGILTLSVHYWAGPSHTWDGTNWAAAFQVTTTIIGIGQMLGGLILLIKSGRNASKERSSITLFQLVDTNIIR